MLGLAPLRSAPLPIRASATPSARASATACGRNTSQQLANGGHLSLVVPEAAEGDTVLPENMHKWRMVIAYDGTMFKGWQYQPSIPTIQYFLEDALICITKLDRKKLCLVGAGRTDTGVHAWGGTFYYTLQLPLPR